MDTPSLSKSEVQKIGSGPIRHRWAFLVGVNQYVEPAFRPLNYCVNDVLALQKMLTGLEYTVVCLHDKTDKEHLLPTRDNIEAELEKLCQVAELDDLLLVHFACHGRLVNGKPVLITREVRATTTLAQKALPLAEVETRMRRSKARQLVLTLDACHVGVEVGRDLPDPEFIRNAYELAEGFALIAGSTAQQIAQEWEDKQQGVFTYYLLEGLSGQADRAGKGFVTVGDLKNHVLDGLRRWSVEQGRLIQEPTARTEGLGDIILAGYRDRARSTAHVVNVPNPFGRTGRITDPA
ncbi:MAG: caspase family protein, partial [Nitrososphaera sp.]|nr:caspase family protein [Nitrososphaera sp.]